MLEGEVEHAPNGLGGSPQQLVTYCKAGEVLWAEVHLAEAADWAHQSAAAGGEGVKIAGELGEKTLISSYFGLR